MRAYERFGGWFYQAVRSAFLGVVRATRVDDDGHPAGKGHQGMEARMEIGINRER